MPRYITPSKICLLVLTHIYCKGQFVRNGMLTVLKLLTDSVLAASSAPGHEDANVSSTKLRTITDLAKWKSKLQGVGVPDRQGQKHENVWTVFVERIAVIDNVDQLFNLFKRDVEEMLLPIEESHLEYALTRASVLGIFVRRSRLEFERIQFQDAVTCFNDLRQFLTDSFHAQDQLLEDIRYLSLREHVSFDMEFDLGPSSRLREVFEQHLNNSEHGESNLSTVDVESLLEFQVEKMQKTNLRLPEEIRDYYRKLLARSAQAISLSHYRSFLDTWYAGDFSTAFENLHRYYDYAAHHKDRAHYQYALLNMAILQSDMGSVVEALDALNECISVAKENKDVICLNFSLGWLYHFQSSNILDAADLPAGMALENKMGTLNFLKAKALEGKMWRTLASALLNETMLHLQHGKPSAVAFEPLYRASHLIVQHNLGDVKPSQLLISSSLFRRLGLINLANVHVAESEESYAYEASAEDKIRASWALARSDVTRGDCEQALSRLDAGATTPISNRRLENLRQMFISMVQLTYSIRRAAVHDSRTLLTKLKTVSNWNKDLRFDVQMLEFDYLCMIESFTQAHNLLDDVDQELAKYDGDTYHRATLLLRKARLFIRIGRPANGFSLTVRCIILAFRTRMFQLLYEAAGIMSVILSNLCEFAFALQIAEAVVYQAEETKDAATIGFIYSAIIDAHMGLFGKSKPLAPEKLEHLRAATDWAVKAHNLYEKMSDVKNQKDFRAKLDIIAFERMQYPDDLRKTSSGNALVDEIVEELRSYLDE